MINWGDIPVGTVIPFPFAAFGTNGESLTLSGLATGDIEVYKGTSITQRASDAGFALIDTDGIDIDSRTGIHGFSIDTGDNTDAGFYTAGSLYWVVVDSVTINSQTVRFLAGTFRLVPAESSAGVPKVDVTHFGGTAGTFSGGRPEVNTTLIEGSDATNQIRDSIVDDATRIDASALNALSSHDPGEAIMGATDLGTGAGLTSLASAANLATLDGAVADIPTNAELATALGTADDAVLAAIAALNDISVANILAATVEGSTTLVQTLRLLNAALGGKASGLDTTTAVYRDIGDTKDRITATVDADGNRSAVTLDLT